ncbi:MAG TPA: hypothetical protein VL460_01255 [Caulobacteraceae bacterium]|jgi:hypothetical protein|nr:hypothetical protein [Caulobacteraceae bacterium]
MMGGFRRGGGSGPMKLQGSLRGDGVLIVAGAERPVRYQLDLYSSGERRFGSGSLDGDLSALDEAGDHPARLRLAGGAEVEVDLQDVEDDGAGFEARGDLPAPPEH